MVISPPTNGIILVILADGEFLPENLNNEKVVVMRRGNSTNRELRVIKEAGVLADESLLKKADTPVCNYIGDGNPLHEHADGSYWFYEATWAFESGPFNTYEDCYNALEAYCIIVDAQNEKVINSLTEELESGTLEQVKETE